MTICWSFVMVVLLTLTALIVPSQPLFQPPAGPHLMDARDFKASKSVIENQIRLHASAGSDLEKSWNVLVGQRGRFRMLVQRGNHLVCDEQLNCKKRNTMKPTVSRAVVNPERPSAREILANYRLPQRQPVHTQSDRMVPTGPNPLHNSNRSQVIFP